MNSFHLFLVNAANLAIQASCFALVVLHIMARLWTGKPVHFLTIVALLLLALLLARAAQDFDRFAADREMLAAHRAMARAHLAFRASLVVMGDRLRDAVHHDQSNRGDPAFAAQVRALHGRDLCCCCAPAACHAHVLERAAAWLVSRDGSSPPS